MLYLVWKSSYVCKKTITAVLVSMTITTRSNDFHRRRWLSSLMMSSSWCPCFFSVLQYSHFPLSHTKSTVKLSLINAYGSVLPFVFPLFLTRNDEL